MSAKIIDSHRYKKTTRKKANESKEAKKTSLKYKKAKLKKIKEDKKVRLDNLENQGTGEEPTEPVEEYPEYVQPTGAHDAYNTGDKITYNGKKYICKINGCVWDPDTYPAGWEEVVEDEIESEVQK